MRSDPYLRHRPTSEGFEMYYNPDLVQAVLDDRERRVREMRKVRDARRALAKGSDPVQRRRRWQVRLRKALRA